MTVRLLVGDVRDRIKEIPDSSVDLVCCSPPFLALRKYGDNPDEMGSERTPADFLDALLELTQEFRRVLTPHGSIAIELGDTYAASPNQRKPDTDGSLDRNRWQNGVRSEGPARYASGGGQGWPLAKSLTLIPTLYPASLAYGWNMLNPAHTFDRWRVRNVIVWARPNPPVGALGDKVRPATSYITVACTSAKRWFDLDAVRTGEYAHPERIGKPINNGRGATYDDGVASSWSNKPDFMIEDRGGPPPLDWWEDDDPTGHATLILPTQPYPGAHYATWPETLAARLIKMMCPLRVCTTCGRPSERVLEATQHIMIGGYHGQRRIGFERTEDDQSTGRTNDRPRGQGYARTAETLGWTDCGHNTWRPGVVLDPFAGSGTTLAVAQGLARDATGIELYETNADLVRERVGMFLEVHALFEEGDDPS